MTYISVVAYTSGSTFKALSAKTLKLDESKTLPGKAAKKNYCVSKPGSQVIFQSSHNIFICVESKLEKAVT